MGHLPCQDRDLLSAHMFNNLGHTLELPKYVKYTYALDEADKKEWFPLHEAVVQPIQSTPETVLDSKKTQNPSDQTKSGI